MLKLPIKTNKNVRLTQPYGNTDNNAWYFQNGVTAPFHNGADFVIASPTSIDTYGTALVCPFPTATVVKITWDTPTATKGNGVTIEANVEGKIYQVVLWHTGEISVTLGQKLKEGDLICYIGNSGLCLPAPTADNPYLGSHLHLMIFEWAGSAWKDANNGVNGAQDPAKYFDYNTWYVTTEDTGYEHDKWPLLAYLKGKDIITILTTLLKYFKFTK